MRRAPLTLLDLLDLFCWGMDQFRQPTLANLLAGYEQYAHHREAAKAIARLRAQQLVERHGRGQDATFTITAKGWQRTRVTAPATHWNAPWDNAWRVVTFDLPEKRRRDRERLWAALRSRKLGFLQRSVWIWPHDLQPMLHEIITINGLPECFCGFKVTDLFLCTNAEIVATAWDWEEINRRHRAYRRRTTGTASELKRAASLAALTRLARSERAAYSFAFSLDPLLPLPLWPDRYAGLACDQDHQEFRHHLQSRLQALA
jgi:phenylacetic acid degradation operon negative regulatory protein